MAQDHEAKQTHTKKHHCETSEHWGQREDLTSSQRENSNSQQRIRIQITLSFSKAILGTTRQWNNVLFILKGNYFQLKILFQDKLLSVMVDRLDLKA